MVFNCSNRKSYLIYIAYLCCQRTNLIVRRWGIIFLCLWDKITCCWISYKTGHLTWKLLDHSVYVSYQRNGVRSFFLPKVFILTKQFPIFFFFWIVMWDAPLHDVNMFYYNWLLKKLFWPKVRQNRATHRKCNQR